MHAKEPRLDKHGFPIPPGFDDVGPSGGAQTSGDGGRRFRFALRLLVVGAVLAALCVHFDVERRLCGVVAQYLGAEAERQYRQNNLNGALEYIDRAIAWSPDRCKLVYFRAYLKHEMKDWAGALDDARRAAELESDDPQLRQRIFALQRDLLHKLGEHREGAALAGRLLEQSLGSRAELLNGRAYARALGGFELEEALVDIDEALQIERDNPSFIDTRGYVLFKLGRYKEALPEFDRALLLLDREADEVEQVLNGQPLRGRIAREVERLKKQYDESRAVMFHHRSETHEKLGNKDQAAKDLIVARELGFNQDEGVY